MGAKATIAAGPIPRARPHAEIAARSLINGKLPVGRLIRGQRLIAQFGR
jgi:hypothetical protein